ncbi:MAG: SRPBCC family protein [Terriglobales bacterium]|jgi:uncharacterized protein YndB with AHSA1/START domain
MLPARVPLDRINLGLVPQVPRSRRRANLGLPGMRTPDGQEFWNAVEYHEIVPQEKIVSLMYFSDPQGNKIEPAQLGIEHEAIDGAYDVTIFEDLGNGQTKLTFIGNEPMESAKNSGQLEGWNQILDKIAAVVAGLAQAK